MSMVWFKKEARSVTSKDNCVLANIIALLSYQPPHIHFWGKKNFFFRLSGECDWSENVIDLSVL